MNVLFVCTGNVCRSPMAQGFLRLQAAERGLDLHVRSTGTHAWEGRAATIEGRRVMRELGAPIEDHRTALLSRGLVDWADLVLCLAAEHEREVVQLYPHAARKTFTLKGFVRLLPSLPPCTDVTAWVDAADAARRALGGDPGPDETDVHDPIGEREEAYRRVAAEIRELVAALAEGFARKGVALRESA